MKFRGRMIEVLSIRKFYSVIVTMAKIAKTCVMRLTADKVYFILTDQNASGCPAVWCELEQESYFNEYNIEGVSQEQNEIFLEFIPDKLAKTLTVLKNGQIKSLKMKLTKKNNVPCLTFEVENERVAVHDVPVAVLPRKVWGEYKEPPMPPFDVSICLPELKKLRHLMERFKTLGQAVTITAGKQGKLSLKVESDEGVFSTHYPDLRVPVYRDDTLPWRRPDSQAVTDPDFSASVRVDLKRLGLFLAGEQLQPKRAIANIVENEVLHMFFVHDDLLVQYFLPATSKM
eukprot:TRINITY_DN12902_c0_g1_i2.p1 TRINITY_DN12902_c0_g1~~TRINITY_DN12902_c0_g1_i2.p1  ORF type:complete len:287 (-),score=101.19 TRINITY_DN12902_c0_g1_i2:138-998(-)